MPHQFRQFSRPHPDDHRHAFADVSQRAIRIDFVRRELQFFVQP